MSEQSREGVADKIRVCLKENPDKTAGEIAIYLKEQGIDTTSQYIRSIKSKLKTKNLNTTSKVQVLPVTPKQITNKAEPVTPAKYPRHNLERALRIPKGILEQNAGRGCTEEQSASFIGVKFNKGPFTSELSSCYKFGLLKRTSPGYLELTDTARMILRPQNPEDEINGLRKAVQNAPEVSEVYEHYRGENLPDDDFFKNALTDKFRIPVTSVEDFKKVFFDSLYFAKLIEEKGDKRRIIDVTATNETPGKAADRLKAISKGVKVSHSDTCFVMMPFADPIGQYYSLIYKPAIEKAGLTPIRADDDIFKTGKIIDQIWEGITSAKVLIAELTTRNANVYYELGLAHALQKPVVLISSNEQDVPFDLHHIRVIYYDITDPFWGAKLIDKIAENIVSALKSPEEALFKAALSHK